MHGCFFIDGRQDLAEGTPHPVFEWKSEPAFRLVAHPGGDFGYGLEQKLVALAQPHGGRDGGQRVDESGIDKGSPQFQSAGLAEGITVVQQLVAHVTRQFEKTDGFGWIVRQVVERPLNGTGVVAGQ